MSDKRYEGETRDWNFNRNFGFIDYEDSGFRRTVFYSSRNIRPDWRGSRAWAFGPCVPVTFIIVRGATKTQTDKKHAENVLPIFTMSEPENLTAYRETSEVVSKSYDYAFLKRPCGDVLFAHKSDILEQHKDRWNFLEIGSPVYHGARFDEGTQRWRADYIELYSFEELESFKKELEPEPEVQPEAEPVLEILAPANRVKTLRQLALERKARHELCSQDKDKL
jgi:hypothetical protein